MIETASGVTVNVTIHDEGVNKEVLDKETIIEIYTVEGMIMFIVLIILFFQKVL
jgi:DMSO/TMAO reductase YedYZ heme-binding membrane subunit